MNARTYIERIRETQSAASDLGPYEFESVVAELLAGFGWQVSVTPPTRDGGYDILGLVGDPSGLQTSWIVECKRYAPGHKVGVEIVRQLIGVKEHIRVPNAAIVTTSQFTKGALEYCRSRGDVHLIDEAKLNEWIFQYVPSSGAEATYTENRQFSSCFVSYSSKDEPFAQALVSSLKQRGIKTWYAPEDIRPGDKIYDQVKSAIASFDRLIVILSDNSINSNWVTNEITMAMQKERQEGRRILFPVSLIDFDRLRSWEAFDADAGIDLGRKVREYYIPNFSDWQNESAFEREVDKIADALASTDGPSAKELRVKAAIQSLRKGGTPSEKREAALSLAQLGRDAGSAVPSLIKALKDPSMYVRGAAAYALGEIDTAEARSALTIFESGPIAKGEGPGPSNKESPAQQLKILFDRLDELRDIKLFIGPGKGRLNEIQRIVEPRNVGAFLNSLNVPDSEQNISEISEALAKFLLEDRKDE